MGARAVSPLTRLRSDRARPYWMVAPAAATILLLFGGGLTVGAAQSVGLLAPVGPNQFTLRHYTTILLDARFYTALALTLYIAVASTVLAVVLAVGAALLLRRTFWGSRVTTFVYQLPLPVPHLVVAAGMVMLLAQSGLLARVGYAVGWLHDPGQFPPVFYDRSSVGIILVYVWKEAPFIGIVLLGVLKSTGLAYEEAAQSLGASAWQRLRYVLLPQLFPSIAATSLIVFAFMFGSFEIPWLLGARYPETLPVMAWRLYVDPDLRLRPEAMALGSLIAVVVAALLVGLRRLAKRGVAWDD